MPSSCAARDLSPQLGGPRTRLGLHARQALVQRRHVERAEDQRTLDQVAQFAHVAGPVVLGEVAEFLVAYLHRRHAELWRQRGDEVLDEVGDVFLVRAQRRQVDLDHLQPVVEVGAEAAFGHLVGQAPVGGGDDAHVHRDLLLAAHRADAPVLQHAQQRGLQRQRQVADLVEEQRAALGIDEQPVAARPAALGRALRVAEQLVLDVFRRHGGAVHRHEGPAAARAVAVQGERGEFLAGARFAGQQHRAVDGGHTLQRALQALDGDRAADQAVGRRRALREGAAQHPVLSLQLGALQTAPHRIEDLRDAKGLEDEVAGAGAQRLDRGVEVGKGGDQHHLAAEAALAQLAQPGDAALARQRDVEDEQVEAVAPHQRVAGLGVGGAVHLAAAAGQGLLEEVAHAGFVVDDEQVGQRPFGRGRGRGHRIGAFRRALLWHRRCTRPRLQQATPA
jgi:hypothetical protein